MIKGLSHITLIVKNLDITSNFLCYVFDTQEVFLCNFVSDICGTFVYR